ncbi:MAG TPA: metallophosphoesterase [Candidatus Lokiarchaeia archaeon]|nr:metallophosphoesterase [Candidatus Lokiarchaeia archaeon]
MLRVFLLSDLHGRIPKIPAFDRANYDAVVLAGDITNGTIVKNHLDVMFQKLDFLGEFYFIPGNSDLPELAEMKLSNPNAICLHQRVQTWGDYEFFGTGGATFGLINNFAMSDEDYEATLRSAYALRHLDSEHQILVAHDPPRDTCLDRNIPGNHVGSQATRKVVEEFQPLLMLCGHIHESRGVEKIGSTTCVNGGAAKIGSGADVTIDGTEVTVTFIDF